MFSNLLATMPLAKRTHARGHGTHCHTGSKIPQSQALLMLIVLMLIVLMLIVLIDFLKDQKARQTLLLCTLRACGDWGGA